MELNEQQSQHWTFAFNIDPALNDGYTEAFKQGDETWWWYSTDDEGPAAGPVPNFTGASFKSMHQWTNQILP